MEFSHLIVIWLLTTTFFAVLQFISLPFICPLYWKVFKGKRCNCGDFELVQIFLKRLGNEHEVRSVSITNGVLEGYYVAGFNAHGDMIWQGDGVTIEAALQKKVIVPLVERDYDPRTDPKYFPKG